MNLDQVTAELRPRGSWEAIDLGASLVKRDWKTIYAVWLAIMLPIVFVFCGLMLYLPHGIWLAFAYWWLEPLADGPVLQVIAQRLFGAKISARDALRQTFKLLRRNWIFLLPIYRFHLSRSLAMPITQLEGLSGKARRNRTAVINRSASNHGVGLTAMYHHLFLALYLGIMALVYLLIPTELQQDISGELLVFIDSGSPAANITSLLMFFVVQALLQPWFIGGGFGLYINRRTHLEAWDVEIAFRRMTARHTASSSRRAALATLSLVLLVGVFWPAEGNTQEDTPQAEVETTRDLERFMTRAETEAAVEQVFADSRFGGKKKVTRWQRIEKQNAEAEDERPLEGFDALTRILAFIAEFALWIIAGILLILLIVFARTMFDGAPISRATSEQPQFHRRKEAEEEELVLVEDVPETVLALWRTSPRDAVALLYRACLDRLSRGRSLRFADGATESECLTIVGTHLDGPVVSHFSDVVRVWQKLAYANELPAQETVESLLTDWDTLYPESA